MSNGGEVADVSNVPVDDADEVLRRNEYWAIWFQNISRGPLVVMLSLVYPAILIYVSMDGVCAHYDGHTSGADGESCTAESLWNETLWLEVAGDKCKTRLPFGDFKYTHDPKLPGCSEALKSYRTNVSSPFTCNCTGDYSYLEQFGNIRIGSVQAFHAML